MKTIVSLMLVLSASTAFAAGGTWGPETPWEKIFKTKALILTYDENIDGLELHNACVTDTEIRSIKGVRTCTELVEVVREEGNGEISRHTDWVCKNWVTTHRSVPRAQVVPSCLEYGYEDDSNLVCKNMGTKDVFVGETINVLVAKGYGTQTTWPGFRKTYTFARCQ